jgi:hypothetical protein
MVDRTFPRHFDNLDEKWRPCCLCGLYQLYPESRLIEENGDYYCANHHRFRFSNQEIDDEIPDVTDDLE